MQLLRFWRTIFLCWLKRETERKIIAKRFRVSFYLSILTGQPIRKFKSIIATENFNIYWSFFFLSSLNHWFVFTLRIIMEFVQIHVALYKPPMYVKISVFVCSCVRNCFATSKCESRMLFECDIDSIICIPKIRHLNAMSQVVNCVHCDYLISLVHRIVRYFSLSSNISSKSSKGDPYYMTVCVRVYI